MPTILHVLDQLSGGGPTRSLIALAKVQRRLGYAYEHRVATLRRDAYPHALIDAKRAGLSILRAPDAPAMAAAIAEADIVQVHFWNSPSNYAFLRRDWPAARLLLWYTVMGDHAPQVITRRLAQFADRCVATSPGTLALPALQGVAGCALVHAPADLERLAGVQPRAHASFNVGYIGTVNFGKLHAEFVAMSAAIDVPNVRIVVCGGGDAEVHDQAVRSGAGERFDFRGFVEDVGQVLSTLDVFGYPLCADTYATSEKSLQEAMAVGIPPVVFPHGGVKHLVRDGETGLVVHTPAEYTQAMEYLYHHPEERASLGANARADIQAHFTPDSAARSFHQLYQGLLAEPKRRRRWDDGASSAAEQFVDALGPAGEDFLASMTSLDPDCCLAADAAIAASSPLLANGEGGIVHYRNAYPEDGWLRYWTGLVLSARGRRAEAAREFTAAVTHGLPPARVAASLCRAEGRAHG